MECDDSANSSDSKDSSKDEQMETDSPPKPDQTHWSSLLNDEEVSDDDTYCESDESDVTSSDESGDDDYQEYLLEQVHVDPKATEELPSIKVEPVSPRQDPVKMEPASDEWEAYSGLNLEEAIRLLKVRDRRVEELKQKLKNVQRDYASVKTQLKETVDMNVESSLEPYNDIPVFNTSVDITTEYHERLCQYFRNFVMTEFDLRKDRSVLFRCFFRLSAFQKYYAVFVLKHALRARERNDVSEYEWLLKCYRNMPSFCNWMSAVLRVSSSIVVSFGQADCFGFSTSQTEHFMRMLKGGIRMHYSRVICSVLHGHATMVGRSTSHLCGNKRCLHPNHLYPENMTANLSRDPCHYGRKAGCKHVPGCLLSMKFNKYDDTRADPNSFVKLVPSTVDLIGDLDFEVGQQISFPIDEILEYERKKNTNSSRYVVFHDRLYLYRHRVHYCMSDSRQPCPARLWINEGTGFAFRIYDHLDECKTETEKHPDPIRIVEKTEKNFKQPFKTVAVFKGKKFFLGRAAKFYCKLECGAVIELKDTTVIVWRDHEDCEGLPETEKVEKTEENFSRASDRHVFFNGGKYFNRHRRYYCTRKTPDHISCSASISLTETHVQVWREHLPTCPDLLGRPDSPQPLYSLPRNASNVSHPNKSRVIIDGFIYQPGRSTKFYCLKSCGAKIDFNDEEVIVWKEHTPNCTARKNCEGLPETEKVEKKPLYEVEKTEENFSRASDRHVFFNGGKYFNRHRRYYCTRKTPDHISCSASISLTETHVQVWREHLPTCPDLLGRPDSPQPLYSLPRNASNVSHPNKSRVIIDGFIYQPGRSTKFYCLKSCGAKIDFNDEEVIVWKEHTPNCTARKNCEGLPETEKVEKKPLYEVEKTEENFSRASDRHVFFNGGKYINCYRRYYCTKKTPDHISCSASISLTETHVQVWREHLPTCPALLGRPDSPQPLYSLPRNASNVSHPNKSRVIIDGFIYQPGRSTKFYCLKSCGAKIDFNDEEVIVWKEHTPNCTARSTPKMEPGSSTQ